MSDRIGRSEPGGIRTVPDLLTAGDVGRLLLVCQRTLRRWEQRGLLRPIRIGGARRYRTDDILKLIDEKSPVRIGAKGGL